MTHEDDTEAVDCVGFIICIDNKVLAERRRLDRRVMPGILSIPGGHVEAGETLEQALARELLEELNVVVRRSRYVGAYLHRSLELRRLHYFAIDEWAGEIENHEAASLHWVPIDDLQRLDLDVDRRAVTACLAIRSGV